MTRDGVTEEQYNWSIEQTLAVMPTMRQHLERAEQRGYDRAIAEVVAWLRADADLTEAEAVKINKNTTGNHRLLAAKWAIMIAMKRGIANAIEAGEHKP